MKLLTLTPYFDSHRGGVELVGGRLARELAVRGFQMAWIASDATAPAAQLGTVRAVPIPALNLTERRLGFPYPVPSPRAVAAILREVAKSDAVLAHDGLYLTTLIAFFAAAGRKPLVLVQHIGAVPYRNPFLRWLMKAANLLVTRPILARADQVVFIGETARSYFATVRFRRPPLVIFNGVDADLFRPGEPAEIEAIRRRLDLPPKGAIALFVGRFVEKKGLEILRMAVAQRPDLTWVFAGWGPLDPRAWRASNVTVIEGLSGASLAELYRTADLLVLPSRGEGFPLVVQEALASGLAVVCGADTLEADPAAAALLTGVELAGGDLASKASRLCAAIDGVLVKGGDRIQRHRFARQHYSWSRAADRYGAIVRNLIAERQPDALTADDRGGAAPDAPVGA